MEEYIKLLDLPDEFDLDDLKKAYRKKVLQYHPDKAANEAEAQQKVVNNWRLPKGELPESIRVKVAFRIGKDGDVIDYPTVKVSSGSSFVDKSCLRTVINSAPFKPIPEELHKDYLDVELDFEADKKQ